MVAGWIGQEVEDSTETGRSCIVEKFVVAEEIESEGERYTEVGCIWTLAGFVVVGKVEGDEVEVERREEIE